MTAKPKNQNPPTNPLDSLKSKSEPGAVWPACVFVCAGCGKMSPGRGVISDGHWAVPHGWRIGGGHNKPTFAACSQTCLDEGFRQRGEALSSQPVFAPWGFDLEVAALPGEDHEHVTERLVNYLEGVLAALRTGRVKELRLHIDAAGMTGTINTDLEPDFFKLQQEDVPSVNQRRSRP